MFLVNVPSADQSPAEQIAEKVKNGRLVGLKAASPRGLHRMYAAHLKVCPFKATHSDFFSSRLKPARSLRSGLDAGLKSSTT